MYLISQAVTVGWRRTLPAAFSPLISDGPVSVLVLLVLSRAPLGLVQYLRLLGGAFIVYLAFGAWKSWREFNTLDAVPVQSGSNNLLKAAIVNWLNPNLYIGWGVILGPMVLSGWRQAPAKGVALVLGFYMTIIATMIAMIVLFSAAGTLGPRVRKSLIGLSAIALAGLGFYQFWLGVSAFSKAS
jgi:threonine/homoserine/homoserine lactone efflux protein